MPHTYIYCCLYATRIRILLPIYHTQHTGAGSTLFIQDPFLPDINLGRFVNRCPPLFFLFFFNLTPYTVKRIDPKPCVLDPNPYTLRPNLHPKRQIQTVTLHPTPNTLHPTPYTLHPAPCTLHPTPYTLHPAPYTLYPTP